MVLATAGSGKTLLAKQLLQKADSMLKIAPVQSDMATFHELSIQYYGWCRIGDLDFGQSDIFKQAEQHYIDYLSTAEPRFRHIDH
ncbi:MAG TPA: hypothetical protein DIS96_12840 [Pusillimonas sp.]|nr:hypothetical protein [Pusillimonas sp.]